MLQRGDKVADKQEMAAWKFVRSLTLAQCNAIYETLRVKLSDDDIRGESDYNDALPDVGRN